MNILVTLVHIIERLRLDALLARQHVIALVVVSSHVLELDIDMRVDKVGL